MRFLTNFSLKNPAALVIIIMLIIVGGVFSASQLQMESMPDISIPMVIVSVPYPGAPPADIVENVTKPLEDSFSNIKGVKNVNSTSAENVAMIMVEFGYDQDMEDAKKQVEQAAASVTLPEEAMDATISTVNMNSTPILKFNYAVKEEKFEELQKIINEKVVPRLSHLEGVGSVQVTGSENSQISIKLKPEKLKQYNLTSQQISQLLVANNLAVPVGEVSIDSLQVPIKINQQPKSLNDLKNMQIPLYPSQQEGMTNAFKSVGEGMDALGQAVGGLGQAVNQMGQGMQGLAQAQGALGQGVGAVQAQTRLLTQIQGLQNQILSDKITLNGLEAGDEKTALEKKIDTNTKTLQQLNNQLKILQSQVPELKGTSGMTGKISSPQITSKPAGTSSKTTAATNTDTTLKTVKLSEIADVAFVDDAAQSITRLNGQNAIGVDIVKGSEANTVAVADTVKKELEKLEDELPQGVECTTVLDQSVDVKASVNGMLREGLLGALFAAVVILIFLRSGRSTLIAVVSIPLSVLISLILLKQAGVTLNIMTLGGMAVAIGRVVDDSIVVIENIYRRLQRDMLDKEEIIRVATKEVASAITSSTLTTVAVFLPLGLVSGIIGKIFLPFALTVVFALLASLLVALTVVPLLAKYLLKRKETADNKEAVHDDEDEHSKGVFETFYTRILVWSLNHKVKVILVSVLLLAGSLGLVSRIGSSFLPAGEESSINIKAQLPSGTGKAEMNKKAMEIEKLLEKDNNVEMYQTIVGSAGGNLFSGGGSSNDINVFVKLSDNSHVNDYMKDLKDELKSVNGLSAINVAQVEQQSGSTNQLEVVITGNEIQDVRETGEKITQKLEKIDKLENVKNNLTDKKEEINVRVIPDKATSQGLSAGQIAMTMRELLTDSKVNTMTVDKKNYEVMLGIGLDPVKKLDQVKNFELQTPLGATVKLSDVAEVSLGQAQTSVFRLNQQEYASVTANIVSEDTGAVSTAVEKEISKMDLPGGVEAKLGGTTEMMRDSFGQLGMAMIVAVGLIYLVLVIAFGEALAPFTILFSLPFAAIGAFAGLWLTGQQISVSSMIGGLMLIGIVVTNAIVLVDRIKQQLSKGHSLRDAIVDSGRTRLRPILMTAIATIFALLPLALGFSEGALISQGLAVVVIGGLTSSTALTLLIVPIVFESLTGLMLKAGNKKKQDVKNLKVISENN